LIVTLQLLAPTFALVVRREAADEVQHTVSAVKQPHAQEVEQKRV
jgi:hypothetical protein